MRQFAGIEDGNGTATDYFSAIVTVNQEGGVLVDANADQERIVRQGCEQPTQPVPLTEVLVNDERIPRSGLFCRDSHGVV